MLQRERGSQRERERERVSEWTLEAHLAWIRMKSWNISTCASSPEEQGDREREKSVAQQDIVAHTLTNHRGTHHLPYVTPTDCHFHPHQGGSQLKVFLSREMRQRLLSLVSHGRGGG